MKRYATIMIATLMLSAPALKAQECKDVFYASINPNGTLSRGKLPDGADIKRVGVGDYRLFIARGRMDFYDAPVIASAVNPDGDKPVIITVGNTPATADDPQLPHLSISFRIWSPTPSRNGSYPRRDAPFRFVLSIPGSC